MALQVWLPLNGDVRNQGLLGDLTVTATPTFADAGKIGKCLSSGSLSMSAEQTQQVLNNDEFTFATWLYLNSDTGSGSTAIFGNEGMTAPNNRRFTVFLYDTLQKVHLSWQNYDSNSTVVGTVSGAIIPLKQWTHLAVTYSKSSKEVKVYLNGAVKESYNVSGDFISPSYEYETRLMPDNSTVRYNDYRIYNHCLSPKEVKEISKGLVLHYKMDDGCLKTANNLVTGLTGGGQCTTSSNIVTISGSNSDTYFYLNTSAALTSGKTYKISCVGNFDNGKYYYFPIGGQTNTSPGQLLVKNGYCSLVFTANDTIQNNGAKIILDDTSRSAGAGTITNITLEEVNGIYDCSGFGYNGSKINSLFTSSDTARYTSSFDFGSDTSNYYKNCGAIKCPIDLSGCNSCTIAFWAKPIGNHSLFCLSGDSSGGGYNDKYLQHFDGNIFLGYQSGKNISFNPTLNEWHNYAITYDNLNLKLYKDGVLQATSSFSNTIMDNIKYIFINYCYAGGVDRKSATKMSDFRFYSTTLSAEDVKELYNTSAMVCDNGTVMAYSLEE